jgi:hypothetical protein
MVSREGLCTVDAWPSVIGSLAEKRVTKDGVMPLRLDSADRGPFKYELLSPPSRGRARCGARAPTCRVETFSTPATWMPYSAAWSESRPKMQR